MRYGVEQADAVETDPVIFNLGRMLHPELPYGSERVSLINEDARSYFKKTKKEYDIIAGPGLENWQNQAPAEIIARIFENQDTTMLMTRYDDVPITTDDWS